MKTHLLDAEQTDEYYIQLEVREDGEFFLHFTVEKWNKTLKKKIQQKLRELLLSLYDNGVRLLFFVGTDETLKFAHKIRTPDYFDKQEGRDGRLYNVCAWETEDALTWELAS